MEIWTWQLIKGKFNFKITKFYLSQTDKRVILGSLKISLSMDSTIQPSNNRPQIITNTDYAICLRTH